MAYAPQPMNQFNRLIYVSGGVTGTYYTGSPWNNYHNGIDYDSMNCTATMGALLRDAHTGGFQKSTPIAIRNHQNDWRGGIGWDDVSTAWLNLYGEPLNVPYGADWNDVIYWLKQGRAVGVQGNYGLVPYSYQCQKGGQFDHAFALAGYRASDGRVLFYDPLCKRASWVPQYVIRPAAERLAIVQRGDKSRLFVSYTKVMPTVILPTKKYQAVVHPGSGYFFRYIVRSGVIDDRERTKTGGFTATCTAPVRTYWPDEKRWIYLVKLTSGSRSGQYVDAMYAEVI